MFLIPSVTMLAALAVDRSGDDDIWTTDGRAFVRPDNSSMYDPDRSSLIDGLWHVTTSLDTVRAEGLKSRQELGFEVETKPWARGTTKEFRKYRTVGLGGSYKDVSPNLVSMTFNLERARKLDLGIRTAARAARGEITAVEILKNMRRIHGWPGRVESQDPSEQLRQWLTMLLYYRDDGEDYAPMYDDRLERVLLPGVKGLDSAMMASFVERWSAIQERERRTWEEYPEEVFPPDVWEDFRAQQWPATFEQVDRWREGWLDLAADNLGGNTAVSWEWLAEAPESWLEGNAESIEADLFGGKPGPEDLYNLVRDIDSHMGRLGGVGFLDSRIGFTATAEEMARIDPDQVGVLQVDARRGAPVEINLEEWEVRLPSSDIRLV